MSLGSGFRRSVSCCVAGALVGAISSAAAASAVALRLAGPALVLGGVSGLIAGAIVASLVTTSTKDALGHVALWAALAGFFLASTVAVVMFL
jgi:hypothetical protein